MLRVCKVLELCYICISDTCLFCVYIIYIFTMVYSIKAMWMKLKDYKYILLTLFIVISLTMRIYAVNDSVSMIVDTLSLKSPRLVSTEQPDSLSPLIYILPKTPQASALSRYGEIPVNLSTGVPNISIPLYNIKAGNYTLPISISYHASGIKTDDVATCVGLGWVLNAGGAITRTVRGLPDLKSGDMNQDTLYWSYKQCYEASKNIESVDLSDEGKYSFTYNRNTNLPYYELHGKASELHASKDYWGYYNGYKKGCGIPLGVVKDAYLCYTTSSFWHQKFDYYEIEDSRYPSLEYAQMLILKGITYPTGGTTSFTYELNTPLNSFGGLRIKQISSCALKRSYTYKNNDCFDSVENFMWRYNTCFYWGNFLGYQKSNFITCSDIPSFSYCNNSSYSVFYPEVTVTYENGEHVVKQ